MGSNVNMSVSCVGTNFSSNVSFRNNENKKENVTKSNVYTFGNHKVTKEDIKEPFEIAKSIGLTAIMTYGTVYCAAEIALFKFAPKAGLKFEAYLKKLSEKTISVSDKLVKEKSEGITSSTKRFIGKSLAKIEKISMKMYKSLSNWGMTKSSDDEERATKALSNLIGIGATSLKIFDKCTTDSDGNGVKDIFQSKFG